MDRIVKTLNKKIPLLFPETLSSVFPLSSGVSYKRSVEFCVTNPYPTKVSEAKGIIQFIDLS